MNKIKSLFKGSPIAVIAVGLLVAGVASAALLTVYVTMTGTMEVKQSVVFANYDTEHTYEIGNSPANAGNTYIDNETLYNTSETTAPIKFITSYNVPGSGQGWTSSEEGIETSYWNTVELRSKDGSWNIIGSAAATLTYELAASTFNYEFEASELAINTDYSLIYYADEPERFENWGGSNPGALIAEFTTDVDGNIYAEGTENEPVEGYKNLAMNLPASPDWNASSEANYCTEASDGYNLCRGAKIWLVPSSDYNETSKKIKDVSWANMANFLFETDLITYDDTDTDGVALWLGEGELNFFVKNVLDIALVPQNYIIKTDIEPAL